MRMLAVPSLWEAVLPEECRAMPEDLVFADRVLNDPGLLEPFRRFFSPLFGRPSIPMETFVRMMFLKYRLDLGYEPLCAEVRGSITYKVFCRIDMWDSTPCPSTLSKLVTRVGPDTIREINDLLLRRADRAGLVDLSRVRVDSTVVPAGIAYPTDSGLLARGILSLLTSVELIRRIGIAVDVVVDDCRDEVRRLTMRVGKTARRRTTEARDEVLVMVDELADLAARTVDQVEQVLVAAEAAVILGFRARRFNAAVGRLRARLPRVVELVAQCRNVARERPPAARDRKVSLHDTDARPIQKTTSARKLQFGYTGQVFDNADGIILDYDIARHYPQDGPRLGPGLTRIKHLFGRFPANLTADRGYGDRASIQAVSGLGIDCVAILQKGKPGAERLAFEKSDRVQRLVKWRSGSEGRVSTLKRRWGWARSRLANLDGAATWCGWGVFAHNTHKLGLILAEIET